MAMQMVSRLRETFELDLPLRQLFESPTIAGVAELVRIARLAGLGPTGPPPAQGDGEEIEL